MNMDDVKQEIEDVPESKEVSEKNLEPIRTKVPSVTCLEELLGPNGFDKMCDKHVFILSSAGKPVYSRCGSEDRLVTLFGVMQALVSVVQDGDDTIQAIRSGRTSIVFLTKGPIILVSVSHSDESTDFSKNQLMYVYNQVVSVLTLTQVTRIFEERHNYDLRRLLAGSERLIDTLLTFTETRAEFLLNAISCLWLPHSARETISTAIVSSCSKIKNLVFAILIGNDQIISIARMKKYNIEPCDIHLICNLVSTSESFKTAESWTPICLPVFNPSGFLHAHVSYLSDSCPACLLLLTVEKDSFFDLSEAKNKIIEKLTTNQCLIVLTEYLKRPRTNMDTVGVSSVRHFLYKCCTLNQAFVPDPSPPFDTPEKVEKLLHLYELLHSSIKCSPDTLKLKYQQLSDVTLLGWVTEKFEMYATFEPLTTKAVCIEAVNKIVQWVQRNEDWLFMKNIHTF